MKIIAILLALTLSLVTGAAARASTASDDTTRQHIPARSSEQNVAYGQDTVCKLGCWG